MHVVMIPCVVGTVVLVFREAFFDLLDAWSHTNHRWTDNSPHSSKPKRKIVGLAQPTVSIPIVV